MTVFIVQEPRNPNLFPAKDFSAAEKFGKVEFIFTSNDSPCKNLNFARARIESVLDSFDPVEDYILWAGGDQVALVLVAHYLPEFKFLLWNRQKDSYGRIVGGYYEPIDIRSPYDI